MTGFMLMLYAVVALAVAVGTLIGGRKEDAIGDLSMLAVVAGTFWPATVAMALIAWTLLVTRTPCDRILSRDPISD